MLKNFWISALLLTSVVIGGLALGLRLPAERSAIGQAHPASPDHSWPSNDPNVLFSAPGVTEPSSRTLQIYSEQAGTLRHIYVKSGEQVHEGQVLFEIANETQVAEVRHHEVLIRLAEAQLAKLESWERPEDRQIAKEQWQEAESMVHLAEFEFQRVQSLQDQRATSHKELIDSRENLAAARARANAAKARYERSIAGPSKEDIEVAKAAVAEAQAQLQVSQTLLDKTVVRSPISGIAIYRYREPGETVGVDGTKPVLSIGNRDILHLRADVDETDIARVKIGQEAFATAEAFGSRRFPGRVVHIEKALGRKNFRTYSPTEKADTKILEVVIALDNGSQLPLDLQMTVWFLKDDATR